MFVCSCSYVSVSFLWAGVAHVSRGNKSWFETESKLVSTFTSLRCGFGLNGIVMHNRAPYNDVSRFREYLLRHYPRRPPDHLIVEYFAQESHEAREYFGGTGQSRVVAAFRHNLFEHLGGSVSTLREEEAWSFPGCFSDLIAPQVFVVEAWNPVDCPHDDIWPCNVPHATPTVITWNTSREAQVSLDRVVYVQSKP